MIPTRIADSARDRVRLNEDVIDNTIRQIALNNPMAAETDPQRRVNRLAASMMISTGRAEAVAEAVQSRQVRQDATESAAKGEAFAKDLLGSAPPALPPGAEAVWGDREFVGVSFLQHGITAAKAVARIAYRDGRPKGTGFMISDRLLITNNHVIGDPRSAAGLVAEFDYEFDINGQSILPTRFTLNPGACFVTQSINDLDYTVIAIGSRLDGNRELGEFGWCGLSGAGNKHMLGEVANIVQHPDGRRKEIVLRENRLAARLDSVLHYLADTEPGSSGSPVYNNQWQVIALHHWGGPYRQTTDAYGRPLNLEVNEGIRISAIVRDLEPRARALPLEMRRLIQAALALGESAPPVANGTKPHSYGSNGHGNGREATIDADGRVTWQFPIEISMRIPMLANGGSTPPPAPPVHPDDFGPPVSGGEQMKPDPDLASREGYRADFLKDFPLPLPALGPKIAKFAAVNRDAEDGDDPHELKYHHFSIVMNKSRKLAFYTACNIDGRKAKKLDRNTDELGDYVPKDFTIDRNPEGAEASETWFVDDRIDPSAQTDPKTQYAGQKVPGFPTKAKGRMPRMLQRGHLVRRMDPVWGPDGIARSAEADTFFVTNCTPQFGAFNMGTGKSLGVTGDGTGGGVLWRALEDHVLGNAVESKLKVTCFTGPIFRQKDPEWRGIRIPLRFWKICVWVEQGKLRSLAMIADQKPVYDKLAALPEGAAESAEELTYTTLVEDFLSTVEEIEEATDLDFGKDIRSADIRSGDSEKAVSSFDEVDLDAVSTPAKKAAKKAGAKKATAKKAAKKGVATKAAKKTAKKAAKKAMMMNASARGRRR
jgi:endonuclease G, mitochondrial